MGEDLEEALNDSAFWHFRYQQQAAWTRETRRYLFSQTGVQNNDHLLDVGCGSGAMLDALSAEGFTNLTGIDLHLQILSNMQRRYAAACADGSGLPFANGQFDHTLCHFTLLWAEKPQRLICEMRRVTRRSGWVFALAEPDYGGRMSYPDALERIAEKQTEALAMQGANTHMGRELMGLLAACGLENVTGGIIGSETREGAFNALSGDLRVLQRDLAGSLEPGVIDQALAEAEKAAALPGAMWYVPVCFACGQVV